MKPTNSLPERPAIVRSADETAADVSAIKQHVQAGKDAGKPHFIKAGLKLLKWKKRLPHGEFKTWIEKRFTFSIRTAERYMKWAEEHQKSSVKCDKAVSHLSGQKSPKNPPRWWRSGRQFAPRWWKSSRITMR